MYFQTESEIFTFLHYGYLPDTAAKFSDLFCEPPRIEKSLRAPKESSPSLLIKEGVQLLKKVFATVVAGSLENHILPLSGGLDSRAILGGLLENVDPSQIQTVTFGSPGTWDFEIGQQVARVAGVHCEPLDLTADSWKWENKTLLETAEHVGRPVRVFPAYVNRAIALRFGTKNVYYSGFMGNPLHGDHLLKKDSVSWEEAKREFIVNNRYANSLNLPPPGFHPENCLPATPFTDPSLVCYDDQIDFGIRQQCFIRHLVLPTGYEYRTPFLHPEWVSFFLGAPRQYRENQWLYKEILKTAFPKLFSLPNKNNNGLPLDSPMVEAWTRRAVLKAITIGRHVLPTIPWGIEPRTNYIDFDKGLRERKDIKELVHENLQDLKNRHVIGWLDLDAIWLRHQQGQANHSDALILLASLEINIKAAEAKSH